jgi:outer membrane protein OmpA-like peptidoglycan-associated protein
MASKLATIVGIITLVLIMAVDWRQSGHFDDGGMKDNIARDIESAPEVTTLKDLAVKVDRRTAHVQGLVDSPEERVAATRAALKTPGILTIVNDLKVDQVLEILLRRIKQQIEADPTEGVFGYRIARDGHTVTLDGWVPEGEDDLRQAIENTVAAVPGVRKVINNLGVGRPLDDLRKVQELILDILRMNNIYFDYNKAVIRPESRPALKRIAGVLQEYPDVRVRIEGHTDAIASEGYNQALSERRADAVKAALIEHGTAAERIETVGHGELRPIAPNTTPEGRADNRRIEFKVLNPNEITVGEKPAGTR